MAAPMNLANDGDAHLCPHQCKCSSAHGYRFKSSSIKSHTESFGQHRACNAACTQHLLDTVDLWCPSERQQVIPSLTERIALAEKEEAKLTEQVQKQVALVKRKDEQRAKRKHEGIYVEEGSDYGSIERRETLKGNLEAIRKSSHELKRQRRSLSPAAANKTDVRVVRLNTNVSLCPSQRVSRVFGAERSTVGTDRLVQLTRLMKEIYNAPHWKAEFHRNWSWEPVALALAHTDSDMSFEELANLASALTTTYEVSIEGLEDVARSLPSDAFHRKRACAFFLSLTTD